MAAVSTIEPETRLKRYLYFCSEESRYISTSRKQHDCCQLSKVTSLSELITADKENVILEIIDSVKNDPLCSRRETLLFVLAALTRNAKTKDIRTLAYNKVIDVCQTIDDLFLFIKFAHCLNKTFSHGLRRVVRNFYLNKEPMDLLRIILLSNSYYGWTHKDIFKVIHIKPEKNTAQEIIVSYIMKNLQAAKKTLEEIEKNDDRAHLEKIYAKLENIDTLKHCHSDIQAVMLIKQNAYRIQQIPSELLKSQIVWECLIPSLEIPDLLPQLVRLNRLGFLKSNNPNSMLNKVVEILSDTKKCIASKIQPAQALIYLKTFERGKPIDPQKKAYVFAMMKSEEEGTHVETKKKEKDPVYFNPPKNNAIISALYKLLQHSFKNVQPTGRRFLITIDIRDEYMKNLCFINKAVTCLEAAAVISLSLVKAEKDVTVALFDGASISPVSIDKTMTYPQVLLKLKECNGGHVVLNSAFNWALKNNKPIDVFLNIIYSSDSLNRVPKDVRSNENNMSLLKRYRQKVHLPNTKMINISLGGKKLVVADGTSHVLDICGYDHHVPKLIEACCKGLLQ